MPHGGSSMPVWSDWALGRECPHPDSFASAREWTEEELAAATARRESEVEAKRLKWATSAARVEAARVYLAGFIYPLEGEDDILSGRKLVGRLYESGLCQSDLGTRRPPKGRSARYPQIMDVERLDGGMVGSQQLEDGVYRFADDPDDEPFLPLAKFEQRARFIEKRQRLIDNPGLLEA